MHIIDSSYGIRQTTVDGFAHCIRQQVEKQKANPEPKLTIEGIQKTIDSLPKAPQPIGEVQVNVVNVLPVFGSGKDKHWIFLGGKLFVSPKANRCLQETFAQPGGFESIKEFCHFLDNVDQIYPDNESRN